MRVGRSVYEIIGYLTEGHSEEEHEVCGHIVGINNFCEYFIYDLVSYRFEFPIIENDLVQEVL